VFALIPGDFESQPGRLLLLESGFRFAANTSTCRIPQPIQVSQPASILVEAAIGSALNHMLNVGKSGNALSRYPEKHPKLCRGDSGDLLAAITRSWASIYCRCVGHDGLKHTSNAKRNQYFLGV
jgi:hypothetical protein